MWNNIYTMLSMPPPLVVPSAPSALIATTSIPDVPFYSQFKDITSPTWQKVGCGIASLAMIIDYYKPAVLPNTLLAQGIAAGAYIPSAGWTYKGLIQIAENYGLDGNSYDLQTLSSSKAFEKLKESLHEGPVIVSIHYKFDPKSTIPHLVVIDGINGDTLYYNDPAAKIGEMQIPTTTFLKAWKKRFIVIRPAVNTLSATQPAIHLSDLPRVRLGVAQAR